MAVKAGIVASEQRQATQAARPKDALRSKTDCQSHPGARGSSIDAQADRSYGTTHDEGQVAGRVGPAVLVLGS